MTVVAAIEHDGAAYVACDSSITADDARETSAEPKWWLHHGVLVAYAGDLRAAMVARDAHRRQRAPSVDALSYVERLHERTRKAFKRERIDNDAVDLLVALRGRVYVVSGGTVTRSEYGYCAIGGGAEYALGSLATSSGDPVERVRAAVVAAIRHSASCGEPVRTEVVR